MSENSDFLRRWIEAWNGRDMEALVENVDPEIEWSVARQHPNATTHRGADEVLAYLGDWLRTMPDLQIVIEDLTEQGDKVLAILLLTGSGAGSGAGTEVRTATLTTFRDGKALSVEEFLDLDEGRRALAAAGAEAGG